MALINCPECGGKISKKAKACPHCGYAGEPDTGLHGCSGCLTMLFLAGIGLFAVIFIIMKN